jgi:hypothetical protein
MKMKTKTLIKALRNLSEETDFDDENVNACVAEAANRLEELEEKILELDVKLMRSTYRIRGS